MIVVSASGMLVVVNIDGVSFVTSCFTVPAALQLAEKTAKALGLGVWAVDELDAVTLYAQRVIKKIAPAPRCQCGKHTTASHPDAHNYCAGMAEREGRTCSQGWPL